MAISKLELMRLSDTYDGEFDFADFSEEELREICDWYLPRLDDVNFLAELG